MKTMKHKVICMDCGKTERIIVDHKKKIESEWRFYGKINMNACETDRYFWTGKDQNKPLENMIKVSNSHYDPKVKPKYVELWTCPTCVKTLQEKGEG